MPKKKMDLPRGISGQPLGDGRVKLHWRQWELEPDGSRVRRLRSLTVDSKQAAYQLGSDIAGALSARGFWEPEPLQGKPAEVNLEVVAKKWLEWKKGTRGTVRNTQNNYRQALKKFFRDARRVHGLGKKDMVPSSILTVETFNAVVKLWREGDEIGDASMYMYASYILAMWNWAVDDETWGTSFRPPPRDSKRVLPPTVTYLAPQEVPTFEDCDEAVRRVDDFRARVLAILLRYTGLRQKQGAAVHGCDLDRTKRTLFVRTAKSRQEAAMARTIPVSPHLFTDLEPVLDLVGNGPLVPDSRHPRQPLSGYRNLTRHLSASWSAAVDDEVVEEGIWKPRNRDKPRPTHVFRSAFQAHMLRQGLQDDAIDFLVGHSGRSTRAQHYVFAVESSLRRAVDSIPPIAWGEDPPLVVPERWVAKLDASGSR